MNDLKQLKKLIKLCRDSGVQSIRFDGVELHLSEAMPSTIHKKYPDLTPSPVTYAPGGDLDSARIVTDELTDEQLLMWSATGESQQ